MIKKIIKKLYSIVVFNISKLIPRNRRIYVFGSWEGNKFSDNSKYLYINSHEIADIRAIWITKNRDVYKSVSELGYEVYMAYSLKGIIAQLRCGIYFTTVSPYDLCPEFLGGAIHVNLWHGIPIKKIVYDDEITNVYTKNKFKRYIDSINKFLFFIPEKNKYIISPSDEISKIYTSAFRQNRNQILELGQPRNDVFYKEELEDPGFSEKIRSNKVILYMPTHRKEGRVGMNISENFDLKSLNDFCVENNVLFVIKKHYYHRMENEGLDNYSNIVDITNEIYDTQMLLKFADILITDYSSCYIDYLLLERPILFYCFDYENYVETDRGLYFEYNSITPGPKINKFADLLSILEKALGNEWEIYTEDIKRKKEFFHSYRNKGLLSSNLIIDYFRRVE
ncbi:CDP-glycerol glycerophosphotransferase family protein [Bacillus cereus group sp. BfR-BA-01119]|uniref:CDP-glycerol glycerophosphotransferase family protein n=1 Tax=Bacillus cereus group TaxID=86661 RepID=UPI00202CDA8F|nr:MULTISPECIES: CDP-glycerol glycerophosphotransferase family protein [unclassified Bacillus cereus group]MCM0005843.1 CDP-glycerol glycerophosphotransferase family protein [Bacillus paranthracis]MDA1957519.1 CDP-glycerol glycerophosphotransferase family protein [Bacillus cereus group sp. BcHK114]MDX5867658.1 CDP-glycerol glycerophosphotransferase family protein [Bacillus cereus group sp. BfR-BA-01119]MDX5910311.1 CDP-glycerol glycerophosphotransferase family protein [Bacillus cereus group sp.